MQSINPATLQVIHENDELTPSEIAQKLDIADKAFASWRHTSFDNRAKLMNKAAAYLRDNKARFGKTISQEVGKTLAAAEAEVEKCAIVCEYYAKNAEAFLKAEIVKTDAQDSFVRFDPIGAMLAVMPWNFPFWQVFRFAAPAIMTGNVGVLKHASNVQMSAEAIEEVFTEAGFPEGVFLNLAIGSSQVASVIKSPVIKAVTLTGSEYAGSQVAKEAGQQIKKTVLELGGSDPFIVRADADVAAAAQAALAARLQLNAGQSCIAAKRFFVHESIVEDFTQKLIASVEALVVGDPLDPKTDVGPLTNENMLTDIERQVNESVAMGAKLLIGGKRLNTLGYYYLPVVLKDVTKDMPVYNEETFGPAIPIVTFKDDQQALDMANDSIYGLGATIFTKDTTKAREMASQIEAGSVFINSPVKSDPRLPFGGVKKSGYGRELSSYGIREFVNIKTVYIK